MKTTTLLSTTFSLRALVDLFDIFLAAAPKSQMLDLLPNVYSSSRLQRSRAVRSSSLVAAEVRIASQRLNHPGDPLVGSTWMDRVSLFFLNGGAV